MTKQSPDRAYLIRCWRERNNVHDTWPRAPRAAVPSGRDASPGDDLSPGIASRWRFSIEEVLRGGKRRGFSDLDSLLDYLRASLSRASLSRAEFKGELGCEREERQHKWTQKGV